MMRGLAVVILAGCGRVGFEPRPVADGAVDGALVDSLDARPDGPAVHNIVFVTSTMQSVCSQGLAAADALCAARATAGGLPGTYRAWLSTPTTNARDRLGSARGWLRPDGKPFADTVATMLVDGKIFYPARLDEQGLDVAFGWTESATDASGAYASGCSLGGLYTDGGFSWATGVLVSYGHLHCFGIDHTTPVTLTPAVGRLAFVSDSAFTPSAGIAAADALCAQEASSNGMAGTYKAFLPRTTTTGASRFNTAGAIWVRTDGVAVVAKATDLVAWNLIAPIERTAGGALSSATVWTGDSPTSPTLASTCNDWTSTAPTGLTTHAPESAVYGAWLATACTTPAAVYCLQL